MKLIIILLILIFTGGTIDMADGNQLPTVLLNNEQIEKFKLDIKEKKWKYDIYSKKRTSELTKESIKITAEYWVSREIIIPARSGHYHHFFCECGSVLKFPPDLIPNDDGYQCTVCGKKYKGDNFDGAVRWKYHNELSHAAFSLAIAYLVENNDLYLYKTKDILLKYSDVYPGPHTSQLDGGIMYQSLCEAVWSIPLTHAYDIIRRHLSATECEKIEQKLLIPIGKGMINVGGAGRGNWGSWHLSAAGVIGYATNNQELIDFGINNFKQQISNELGEDGLWPESVHTYHFYPLEAFVFLAQAAANNGNDLFNWQSESGKSLKKMFVAPLSYMYPDQRLPAINDGWFESYLPLGMYELANFIYKDVIFSSTLFDGYANRNISRSGMWALLFGDDLNEPKDKQKFNSINFPVLGISVLRSTNNSMMTFDYGPFLGHGQPDKMGITLYANDMLLAADYGTPGYGSPILKWYTGTPAHNTIVVDGISQKPTKERLLKMFYTGKLLDVSSAITEQAYPGIMHERTIIRSGDSFIIIDKLNSKEDHTYDWFFRSKGILSVALHRNPESIDPGYDYVEPDARYIANKKWQAVWENNETSLRCFMFTSINSDLFKTECPAESAMKNVSLLINRIKGKECVFVSVLIPCKSTDEIKCDFINNKIKIVNNRISDEINIGNLCVNNNFSEIKEIEFTRYLSEEIIAKEKITKEQIIN